MLRQAIQIVRGSARSFSAAAASSQQLPDLNNTQFRENLRLFAQDGNITREDGSLLETVVVEPRYTRIENEESLSTPLEAHSTIILLQDNLIVTDDVRYLGIKIAHQLGVRCVIPNIAADQSMDHSAYMRALEDVNVTRQFITSQYAGDAGIVGLGNGGGVALAAAAHVDDLQCAVSFYGRPPSSVVNLSILPIPVQAHFGSVGDQTDAEYVRNAFESLGRKSKKESWWLVDHDVFSYEGAATGFMNELPEALAPGQEFNKERSQLAISRVHEFLVLNRL